MKNNIFKYSTLAFAVAAVFPLQSCEVDEGANIPLVELGAPVKEYVVEADDSAVDIEVYSNGPFHIEFVGESRDWLALSQLDGNGDSKITATCSFNEEFKRMAGIVFCSDEDTRRDTVYVKQKGMVDAVLKLANTSVVVPGKGGLIETAVETNVPYELMDVKIDYSDEANTGWIAETMIEADPYGGNNGSMQFTTEPNPDETSPRTASVSFSFTDDWGDKVSIHVNLVQKNAKEGLGRILSFTEFKDGFSTGKPIDEYVIVEGLVVSNKAGGNAGENEQTTTSSIDYTSSNKTVYLESMDGADGISIIAKTADDNIFCQYDKVQVLLYGTTLVMLENPERYVLSGVTKAMVVSQVPGTKADIPVKEKYMGELTDRDVYTYVTLKDVEIPVRKGAICPVNEGYTIATGAHRISKYPRLVRDAKGCSMYMYTNTVCTYRNDGSRLPYGSGKISGVIVHERFPRFDWRNGADPADMDDDPTLGNIGRYQIRHQIKEDVWGQMNDSVENSFSALLTEYRYWNPDTENAVMLPTYGNNGWMTHTYCTKYTGSETLNYTQTTWNQHMWGVGNYDYLGPAGNNVNYMFGDNWGNHNGIGVVLDPLKESYNPKMDDYVSHNPDGTIEWAGPNAVSKDVVNNSKKGAGGINNQSKSLCGKNQVYGVCFTGFGNHFWWNDETQRFYSWLFNFSTKGISTDHLSMQISVQNSQQTLFSPRYWRAEWSEVESQAPEDDVKWHLIADYTIPDVSIWSNTLFSSLAAYKTLNFELPLEMLDKENVYIRLHPINDICSDGSDYANATLKDSSKGAALAEQHASAISYFAIRYNK